MQKCNFSEKSFTLIEMLIVIAIFGIVAGASSFLISNTRNKISLEDAQATVLNALERAKNRAATGVGEAGTDHGVKITGNQIINFSTGTVSETDYESSLPGNVSVSGPNEIIFNRLSGTSDASTTITIFLNGRTATVSVATSGNIGK